MGSVSIYRALLAAQLRAQATYRGSFAIDLAANALIPLIDLAAVVALFQVTPSLGGFSVSQVLVIFGLSATSFALADLIVGNIERIRLYVRHGTLDATLIRPLSVLGQLLSLDFTIRRVARLAVAVAVLAVAVWRTDVVFSPARVALLVVAPMTGALFFAAVFVATATVAFWWIDSGEFSRHTRSRCTATSSGACSRTRWGSRSSATTRRWHCWAAPTPSGYRRGWAGRRRWSPWPRHSWPPSCGGSALGTTGVRGRDRRRAPLSGGGRVTDDALLSAEEAE